MKNGVCIRVIGDLSLLDDELRNLVAQIMLMTKNNKKAFLNIAFAYTCKCFFLLKKYICIVFGLQLEKK